MKIYYALTTLDAVVISLSNATTNNHQVLDYIPGSTILGAVASKLYSSLDDEKSWHLFHSGNVQFGPAYAEVDGEMALPIPASWHYPKGESAFSQEQMTQVVENHSSSEPVDDSVQFKQCRSGYVNSQGRRAELVQGMVTKTALDRQLGGVKDGQLFSYAYLAKGQRFIGWVECDSAEFYDVLEANLTGQHRIGRSRGSEFGRVTIELLATPEVKPVQAQSRLVLWCCSDCQCVDELGLATVSPQLSELVAGASGVLNAEQSFIRTHTVTRFNQKRGGFDSEQVLISKGSVLVYDQVQLSQAQLQSLCEQGIGVNRQQGLGWVMVNPSWASNSGLSSLPLFCAPCFTLPATDQQAVIPASTATSPLIAWVNNQSITQQSHDLEHALALEWLQCIIVAYVSARRYNRILHDYQAGPSSSQWRRIADLLRDGNLAWKAALFSGKNAVCKAENDPLGWGLTWHNGEGFITFAQQFKTLLDNQTTTPSMTQMRRFLELLSRYDLSVYPELKRAVKDFALSLNVEEPEL